MKTVHLATAALGLVLCNQALTQSRPAAEPPPAAKKITVTPSGRITAPPLSDMNSAQKEEYERSVRGFGGPAGPRMPLLNSPDVLQAWQGMQVALSKSALPRKLREVAILAVAREWQSEFEWYAHAEEARRQGISAAAVEAIRVGNKPSFTSEDESVVYAYANELMTVHRVSDDTYRAAWKLLGTRLLVDLTVLLGHYTSVSITLNAHEVPLPDGVEKAFPR